MQQEWSLCSWLHWGNRWLKSQLYPKNMVGVVTTGWQHEVVVNDDDDLWWAVSGQVELMNLQ